MFVHNNKVGFEKECVEALAGFDLVSMNGVPFNSILVFYNAYCSLKGEFTNLRNFVGPLSCCL